MEDEKGVKIIVIIIVSIVLLAAGIIAFLLYKEYHIENRVEESTTPTKLSKIICNKWNNADYNKYQELTLIYNYNELYQLDVLYQYTYKLSFDKDKVRNDLKDIIKKETKKYDKGITGKYETFKEGGKATLSYDLKESSIRLYVNSEYFHNNIYYKPSELAQYLKDNDGYNCSVDLAIQ